MLGKQRGDWRDREGRWRRDEGIIGVYSN